LWLLLEISQQPIRDCCWISNPYIFVTQCCKPLIFQTMKFVKLNNLSLKNQNCTPSGKISFCGKDSIPLKHNFFLWGLMVISPILYRQFATVCTILKFFDCNIYFKWKRSNPSVPTPSWSHFFSSLGTIFVWGFYSVVFYGKGSWPSLVITDLRLIKRSVCAILVTLWQKCQCQIYLKHLSDQWCGRYFRVSWNYAYNPEFQHRALDKRGLWWSIKC